MSSSFNGWKFSEQEMRRKMKYLVVIDGDLDLNNAYAFANKHALKKYLRESTDRVVHAVFAVSDMMPNA